MEEGEAAGRWGRGGVEGFNAWMKCFCVVNFDLEYGQSACDCLRPIWLSNGRRWDRARLHCPSHALWLGRALEHVRCLDSPRILLPERRREAASLRFRTAIRRTSTTPSSCSACPWTRATHLRRKIAPSLPLSESNHTWIHPSCTDSPFSVSRRTLQTREVIYK